MSLSTVATVETKQELKLTPAQKRKLMTEMRCWEELNDQIKVFKEAARKHTENVGVLLEQLGVDKATIDGYKATVVRGTTSKLDKQKFVSLGGSLEMLENATVQVAKRPYTKITAPGGSDDSE